MNLFDILKQFKNIEPDARSTERSKRAILSSPQPERRTVRGIFIFLRALESGVAVVLVGFFILILTGSLPGSHSIGPIQYSVIDPQGLHAEAQAINMQIQLVDVNYPQVTSTLGSTVQTGAAIKNAFSGSLAVATGTSTLATSTVEIAPSSTVAIASSTPSSTLSIDQALQKLSQ
jgi:hypothetical protein